MPNFVKSAYRELMATMNISLPDALRDFVEHQVAQRHYSTSSEYVRELIRKDQERVRLRALLIEGLEAEPTGPADGSYFDALRHRARPRERG